MFSQFADIHLPITPGTDLALLNSIAHVILAEVLLDESYIEADCNDFDELKATVR
jgi:anaerobic selenocysteine-containing dehydrogenase